MFFGTKEDAFLMLDLSFSFLDFKDWIVDQCPEQSRSGGLACILLFGPGFEVAGLCPDLIPLQGKS